MVNVIFVEPGLLIIRNCLVSILLSDQICTVCVCFRNNFLQVDIFYKELSFEEVVQNKAFVLGSLMGEVGGFMGLLLGASIITLIELIDFLFMACLKRCKARTSPAAPSQPSQSGVSRG